MEQAAKELDFMEAARLRDKLKKLKENKADYNLMNKPSWQQAIIILA